MKLKNLFFWVFLIVGAFLISGCYTQLKIEDDDYAYKKERKRVIIEKRVEEKDGETVERVDTTYESTDDYGYDKDVDHYYYPRHRRAYKFYHPGITIVVGGAVYYDPWYFDYFYYPYTICRTYYLPWWYGYYSCYRVWYGFVYYDPFYNPFYAPPYWWYDPYWYGGYYPPIVQYRKNDYTRLRDQDGGRSGLVRTGNWGRDLNIQVATERTRLRDVERTSIRTGSGRERDTRIDTDLKVPSTRDRGTTLDRETRTTPRTQEKPNTRKENVRDQGNDRNSTPPIDRGKVPNRNPDRTPNTGRERIDDRPNNSPDRKENPSSRRYESFVPNLEQRVIIERNTDYRNSDLPSKKNNDANLRNYRNERIRIEYEVPRREYTPKFEERRTETTRSNDSKNDENVRNSTRSRYERPSYDPPRRTETPRYEPPRFETPSRNNSPSYTPPSYTPSPSRTPSTSGDRGRDR